MAEGDFGIAIGIDRYRDLDRLSGAVADAKAFHCWMLGPARVPEGQTALITSPPRGRAGKPVHDEIDDELSRLIGVAGRDGARRLYIYFAGHGCSAEQRHVNLLLANASKDLLNRGLDAASYQKALEDGRWFPEQIFFYDCCRTFDARARGLPPGFTIEEDDMAAAAQGHVTQFILYAVLFGQRSAEHEHGLFTTALLDGLDGGAAIPAVDDEGYIVTTASLAEHISDMLQDAARDGFLQEPSRNDAGPARQIVLVDDAKPRLQRITVRCPPGISEVLIWDRDFKDSRRWSVTGDEASNELRPGMYTAELPSGRRRTFGVGPTQPNVVDIRGAS